MNTGSYLGYKILYKINLINLKIKICWAVMKCWQLAYIYRYMFFRVRVYVNKYFIFNTIIYVVYFHISVTFHTSSTQKNVI